VQVVLVLVVRTDPSGPGSLQGTPFLLDQGWGGNLLLGFEKDVSDPHAMWLFLRSY